jgi:hypothetical protein
MATTTTSHRPIGITIIAVLAAVAAVVAAFHTLQYLHVLPFSIGQVTFWGFDLWGAVLWGLTTLVWVWVVVQLWNMNPQGWMFLILISGFNLILAVISLIGGTSFADLALDIVVNAAIFLYCWTPGVKSAFGQL